ncbi:replication protein RepA [Limobrevibacterium gyesilva]|uniref:Replication protein RepA n=1 Tax=Limobrevibacterium gyesilva TaxID=2991712 RepID=A0AA42CGN3_9PROT|nr:replication protein RepA [Limobrevibacterium gyesilva]MCW3476251.1 replication protein RepA [Limobrevibacterium gyesilva]
MGTIHDIMEARGKGGALEAGHDRSLVETAALYMGDEDGALNFVYSGWAQCALPHRKLGDDVPWEIAAERVRLVVEPGRRPSSDDGPLEWVGVPFGSHARLILLYLQTEALKTGSREVELGRSLRDWLRRIGVSVGGRTGKLVKEQAERISRCRLTFHLQGGKSAGLINQSIVDRALFIEDPDDTQGRLSLETAKLSEGFFEQLRRHPVPLEEAAIRAINNNPAALDAYLWLAYRLHVLSSPKLITWKALKGQFGAGFKELHHFKHKWRDTLQLALAVYPAANVEVVEAGVILKPSRPPVAPRVIAIR